VGPAFQLAGVFGVFDLEQPDLLLELVLQVDVLLDLAFDFLRLKIHFFDDQFFVIHFSHVKPSLFL
jgi:hypothetical protein